MQRIASGTATVGETEQPDFWMRTVMRLELPSVHTGTDAAAAAIKKDFSARRPSWLASAAEKAVLADYKQFKKG